MKRGLSLGDIAGVVVDVTAVSFQHLTVRIGNLDTKGPTKIPKISSHA